jgi:monoamine oxidase
MSQPIVKHSNPSHVAKSAFYHHVSTITTPSRIIYTAGQIGRQSNGSIADTYLEQVTIAVANLKACLESQGAEAKDIVKLTYYIVDYDSSRREHADPLYAYLGDVRPPTTLVPVPALALPGLLFEIEAVASVAL